MKGSHAIASACIAILCSLLASCIDGYEEIWLKSNGSGHARLQYSLPAAAAKFHGGDEGVRELIGGLLKDHPSSTCEVVTKGDRIHVDVSLDFKSASELSSLTGTATRQKTPASFDHLAGKFIIDRNYRTVDFTRTVSPGKALPTALIPASQFKNRRLTYIIHLPVVPLESTADRSADGGRTLIWDQALSSAIRKPIVMHFKAKIPIPGWLIASAVLLAVILLAALAFVTRKLFKGRLKV